jgi:hypothetical protein
MVAGRHCQDVAVAGANRFRRLAFAAALFLGIGAPAAQARGDGIERQLKAVPGHDVRFAIFTDIKPDRTPGQLPAIRLAAVPAHGVVTVKRATLKATNIKQCLAIKQCLVIDVQAFVALYRAAADFNGPDSFELDIAMPEGRKWRECVDVRGSGAERHSRYPTSRRDLFVRLLFARGDEFFVR